MVGPGAGRSGVACRFPFSQVKHLDFFGVVNWSVAFLAIVFGRPFHLVQIKFAVVPFCVVVESDVVFARTLSPFKRNALAAMEARHLENALVPLQIFAPNAR